MPDNPAIWWLWGAEDYRMDTRFREILQRFYEMDQAEPEVIPVDSGETSLRELGQLLGEVPLFAFRRVIVLRHPVWLGKAKKADKEEFEKMVLGFAANASPGLHLVILSRTAPAGKVLLTAVKKTGSVEEFAGLGPKDLADWVNREINRRGLTIDREALSEMTRSNRDMYYLQNEIDRLALGHPGQKITTPMLTGLEQEPGEANVFKLTDALLKKNTREAMRVLDSLLDNGQPVTLLVHMITRELIFLGKVQALAGQGRNTPEIAQYFDKKPFRIDKMRQASIRPGELPRIFELLSRIDFAVKNTTQDHRLLLETMVVDVCEG